MGFYEPATCEDCARWFQYRFPVDGNGMPTTQVFYFLIAILANECNRSHSTYELGMKLDENPRLLELTCNSLQIVGLLSFDPRGGSSYQFNPSARPDLSKKVKDSLKFLSRHENWEVFPGNRLPYSPLNPSTL